MTTREIGRHTRPIYDYMTTRARSVTAQTGTGPIRTEALINGNQDFVIRFFKGETILYCHVSHLTGDAAKLAYAAYKDAVETWKHKSTYAPMELKKAGYEPYSDDWDRGEVNGKPFPRI